jgi:hypothetical protein
MSKHVSRRERWASDGPARHRCIDGPVVRRYKGDWWADVAYLLLIEDEGGPGTWQPRLDTIGPFRRPRNAMVEAERHATALRGRHRERIRLAPAPAEGES